MTYRKNRHYVSPLSNTSFVKRPHLSNKVFRNNSRVPEIRHLIQNANKYTTEMHIFRFSVAFDRCHNGIIQNIYWGTCLIGYVSETWYFKEAKKRGLIMHV